MGRARKNRRRKKASVDSVPKKTGEGCVVTTSTMGSESSSGKALRNVLILREIFAHCSTRLLLRSCSLVNKIWNNQVRTVIRNHRKCLAKDPENGSWSASEFMENLGHLCAQIQNHGREIPLTGLKINLNHGQRHREGSHLDGTVFDALPAGLKLKHLEISSLLPDESGFVMNPVVDGLLSSNSTELTSLSVDDLLCLWERLTDETAKFPKLQELSVFSWPLYDTEMQKGIVNRMLERSPTPKRILVKNLETLEIVPEEKRGLLGNLYIKFDSFEEEIVFWEILEKKPKLTELSVFEPNASGGPWAEYNLRPRFLPLLRHYLETYHKELKSICVDGFSTPELFSGFPLVNLSKATFTASHRGQIDEFWDAIASINFQEVMPQLEEIRIHFLTLYMARHSGPWPGNDHHGEPYISSSTVWKLTLEIFDGTFNMNAFKALFPNVTSLELSMPRSRSIPYSEIWELWPQLEYLKITGEETSGGHKFDAEFCGIHEEEAELLREMDEEDLKVVQVVPIRPCLLTMFRLRKLWLNLRFYERSGNVGWPAITTVAQLVALVRAKHTKVFIDWTFIDQPLTDSSEEDVDESFDGEEETEDDELFHDEDPFEGNEDEEEELEEEEEDGDLWGEVEDEEVGEEGEEDPPGKDLDDLFESDEADFEAELSLWPQF